MTRTIPRLLGAAAIAACTVMLVACGGDDNAQDALPGATPTTINPGEPQDPNLESIDGYLISASETAVVLHTADGEQTFAVAQEDVPQLGIGHLQSHAGIQTLGFRVFYAEEDGQRFVKAAQEIAPPAIERPAQPTPPARSDE